VPSARDELACRPDPVPGRLAAGRAAAIHLGLPSPAGSSGLPAGSDGPSSNACAGARGLPLGLALGGVYPAVSVTRDAGGLLHHRFTLTPALVKHTGRGGLFSVALSRGSPRVAVSNHPALWSPDFPRTGSPRPRPPCRLVRPTTWMRTPCCSDRVYAGDPCGPARRFSAAARLISTALSPCSSRRGVARWRRLGKWTTSLAATIVSDPSTWHVGPQTTPSWRGSFASHSHDNAGTLQTATTRRRRRWPGGRQIPADGRGSGPPVPDRGAGLQLDAAGGVEHGEPLADVRAEDVGQAAVAPCR
jgi:hypothetical protein